MNEPNQGLVGWMGTEEVNERVETSCNTHCVHLYLIPLEEEVFNCVKMGKNGIEMVFRG